MSFKYQLTCLEGKRPEKKRISDAGYDLHLVKFIKEQDGVYYYDTGVAIELPYGYYGLLAGRSSIAKSGYMLANSIGVIDNEYRGSLIVALIKIRPDVADLQLPNKLVQLLPIRQCFQALPYEVPSLDETNRQDTGGLGSGQFVTQSSKKELGTQNDQ
jgi:dUTP pyrophosphatase